MRQILVRDRRSDPAVYSSATARNPKGHARVFDLQKLRYSITNAKVKLNSLFVHVTQLIMKFCLRMALDMADDAENSPKNCDAHPTMNTMLWGETLESGSESPQRTGRQGLKTLRRTLPFCEIDGRTVLAGRWVKPRACKICFCRNGSQACQTVKVQSCDKYEKEVGKVAMMADTLCQVQCAK